jgi:predicted transcriptional regulator
LKVGQIRDLLDAKVLAGEEMLDSEVISACGSDLMSDVLAYVKEQTVLLTGLTNPHVIRTAEMLDVTAIVFVRGKAPMKEIISMAEERGMIILTTQYTLYEACGILYQSGLSGETRGIRDDQK